MAGHRESFFDPFIISIYEGQSYVGKYKMERKEAYHRFTEGGFSVIDRREIEKFLHIMKRWEELFQCSPEEFYLTRRNNSREYQQKEGVLVRKKEF